MKFLFAFWTPDLPCFFTEWPPSVPAFVPEGIRLSPGPPPTTNHSSLTLLHGGQPPDSHPGLLIFPHHTHLLVHCSVVTDSTLPTLVVYSHSTPLWMSWWSVPAEDLQPNDWKVERTGRVLGKMYHPGMEERGKRGPKPGRESQSRSIITGISEETANFQRTTSPELERNQKPEPREFAAEKGLNVREKAAVTELKTSIHKLQDPGLSRRNPTSGTEAGLLRSSGAFSRTKPGRQNLTRLAVSMQGDGRGFSTSPPVLFKQTDDFHNNLHTQLKVSFSFNNGKIKAL